MNELQHLLSNENKDAYVMGDMNIDLLKFSTHGKTCEYLENIFSNSFLPLITKPTRISDNSATLIDHIYAKKQELIVTSGIIVSDVSDHFGIFAIIKQKLNNEHTHISPPALSRSFSDLNIEYFNNILHDTDYSPVMTTNCPETAYNNFINIYRDAFDKAFPLRIKKIPRKYLKRSPWLTKGIIKSTLTKTNY
jgi:hypothetical protein